jgi:hypothetical protein
VRTAGVAALRLRKPSAACCKGEQQHPECELEMSRRVSPPRMLLPWSDLR